MVLDTFENIYNFNLINRISIVYGRHHENVGNLIVFLSLINIYYFNFWTVFGRAQLCETIIILFAMHRKVGHMLHVHINQKLYDLCSICIADVNEGSASSMTRKTSIMLHLRSVLWT